MSLLTHAIGTGVREHGIHIARELLDSSVGLGDRVETSIVAPSTNSCNCQWSERNTLTYDTYQSLLWRWEILSEWSKLGL